MEREWVHSRVFRSVGYDPATGVLELEFKGGRIYQYEQVPAELYPQFFDGRSVGHFYNSAIKGRFQCRLVGWAPLPPPTVTLAMLLAMGDPPEGPESPHLPGPYVEGGPGPPGAVAPGSP